MTKAQRDKEARALGRAINKFVKDLKLPGFPHVTSQLAVDNDPVYVHASASAQTLVGIDPKKIGHQNTAQLTGWLETPQILWRKDRAAKARSDKAIKAWVAKYTQPYVFPIDGTVFEMRTDRGQDMQGKPGKAVRALGDSIITAIPTNQGSAVASYGQIVGELLKPFHWGGQTWRWWYSFHLNTCYVRLKQRVPKGFHIADLAKAPPGAEDSPGWNEYGFALTPGGDIDQNVGDNHNAPSGNAMHALLHGLAPTVIHANPILALKKSGHDPLGILTNE